MKEESETRREAAPVVPMLRKFGQTGAPLNTLFGHAVEAYGPDSEGWREIALEALRTLQPETFSDKERREAWEKMKRLDAKGKEWDRGVILRDLDDVPPEVTASIETVGGISPEALRTNLEEVREHIGLGRFETIARSLANKAKAGDLSLPELLYQTGEALEKEKRASVTKVEAEDFADLYKAPMEWPLPIVEGFAYRRSLTLLAASSMAGKTPLLRHLVVKALRGEDFFGAASVKAECVLWISKEDSRSDVLAYFASHKDFERKLLEGRLKVYVDEMEPSILIDTPEGKEYLRVLCEKHRPGIVVIDTFHEHAPTTDAFKAENIRGSLIPLRSLARKYDAAVILTHHVRKSAEGRPGGIAPADIKDSEQFRAASQVILTYDRAADDEAGKLKLWRCKPDPAQQGREVYVRLEGKLPSPLEAKEALEGDGTLPTWTLTETDKPEAPTKADAAVEAAIEALGEKGLSRSALHKEITEKTKVGRTAAYDTIKRLEESGRVKSNPLGILKLSEMGDEEIPF